MKEYSITEKNSTEVSQEQITKNKALIFYAITNLLYDAFFSILENFVLFVFSYFYYEFARRRVKKFSKKSVSNSASATAQSYSMHDYFN